VAVFTEIETTDGVTSAEIDLALIELLPISMAVLLAGHDPDLAKDKAWVRLSAHTTTLPAVDVVAAVATVPATSAPATKAMVTFRGVRVIFMSR
jgi:copper chaperone CopZ